jgi:hypothetical protein
MTFPGLRPVDFFSEYTSSPPTQTFVIPEDINKLSSGITKVWVGGELVYSEKKSTGLRPGKVIRRDD